MDLSPESFQTDIDYKKIVKRLLSYRKLYIVSLVIFLAGAFIYNKTAKVVYQNSTTIMISEKDRSALSGAGDFMQGMAFLGNTNNIENEIELLRSFSLVKAAIQNLDFRANIYSYEKSSINDFLANTSFVKKKELYDSSPIQILIDPSVEQATYLNFDITFLNENSFTIEASGEDVFLYNYIDDAVTNKIGNVYFKKAYQFGEEIKTKYFSFVINKTASFDPSFTNDNYLGFFFNNLNYLTFDYQANLSAEPISQTASIIHVSQKGSNFNKITDFLNSLSAEFLNRNLEKKNNAASSTVSFIDAQISDFKDSLSYAEADLKRFRTSNKVMDLSFQGQQVFTKLDNLETEKATLNTQKRYYVYLDEYFKGAAGNELLAPTSMNVVDPLLNKLVSELITLNSERVSISKNNLSSENILLKDLDLRINNLKKTIQENVDNSIKNINLSLNEIDYRINKLSNQIAAMPRTELQLKGIERKFELNNTIYTFLLQKRSEAQIAKASSMPDYEIIEPARKLGSSTVSPKRKLNLLIAVFLGLAIPTGYIFALDFFNNKISDINEVERMANKPVFGKIFRNYHKTNLIVAERPNSSVAESFRSVRTNFDFFAPDKQKQVVLFTSSTSGDGKTFCSINFASVLALNGYKVALLEFDLRRPKIHQEFGNSNLIGITSYLIDKAVLEDVINQTEIPNLDLITAGPAAPNPAELISSEKTNDFIEKLREIYDYIIIDSPPVGIVSETYLLMKQTDMNVFVVRLDATVQEAFANALKGLSQNNFTDYSLLINDINIRKESFKYGYDNKYYSDNNVGFFSKLFGRKS